MCGATTLQQLKLTSNDLLIAYSLHSDVTAKNYTQLNVTHDSIDQYFGTLISFKYIESIMDHLAKIDLR